MNNLKTTIVSNYDKGMFENELEELINSVEDASIQYRTSTSASGVITFTALVISVPKEELTPTAVPTGVGRTMDERLGVDDQTTE
jgi:hypothetical protein